MVSALIMYFVLLRWGAKKHVRPQVKVLDGYVNSRHNIFCSVNWISDVEHVLVVQ